VNSGCAFADLRPLTSDLWGNMVPGAGLEPARTLPGPRDFKSRASTNFAIRAHIISIAYSVRVFNVLPVWTYGELFLVSSNTSQPHPSRGPAAVMHERYGLALYVSAARSRGQFAARLPAAICKWTLPTKTQEHKEKLPSYRQFSTWCLSALVART
jgi:hypothetical protein